MRNGKTIRVTEYWVLNLLDGGNAKKKILFSNRYGEIDRENRILLQKMSDIMRNPSGVVQTKSTQQQQPQQQPGKGPVSLNKVRPQQQPGKGPVSLNKVRPQQQPGKGPVSLNKVRASVAQQGKKINQVVTRWRC